MKKILLFSVLSAVILSLASCGNAHKKRVIPEDVLKRKATAYSGFRADESPDSGKYPTDAEITEDFKLLLKGGWSYIRLYNSGEGTDQLFRIIKNNNFDIKVHLGINIAGSKAESDKDNQAEIKRAIDYANKYKDIIAAVSVGNEAMDDWSARVPAKDIAEYIVQVRKSISQPVTTDDSTLPFLFGKEEETSYADAVEIVKVADFLSLHVYPSSDAPYPDTWEYKLTNVPENERASAMMKAAMDYVKKSIRDVRSAIKSKGLPDIPIIIGESGWKDKTKFPKPGQTNEDTLYCSTECYMVGAMNQKIYYDDLMNWVYGDGKDADSPLMAFWFEAFDEPWKNEDDHWGLFNVKREPKYVIWNTYPDLVPKGAKEPTMKDANYFR